MVRFSATAGNFLTDK